MSCSCIDAERHQWYQCTLLAYLLIIIRVYSVEIMPGIHTCFASEFIRDQAVKEGAVKQTLTQTGQLRCLIRACQNRSITSKDGKTSSPLTFLLENRIKKQKEVLIKLNYSIKIIVKSRENQKLLRGSQFQLNNFLFNFQIFSRQFPAAFNFFF
jgi:hypothetical protein